MVLNQLTVAIIDPPEAQWPNHVELRLLVDGRDVIADVFDRGPNEDPDRLLGPDSPLLPDRHPHETRVAEAICTEGCCGAIYVRVRRDGDTIVWDQWRNPDNPQFSLPAFRFDVAQYEAELARVHEDRH